MLLATYTALLLSLEIYTLAAPIRNGQLPPSFSVEAVLPTSFADPCIIQESSGTWWAFASNGTGANVPVALSQDFAHWQEYSQQHSHFDALPHPGAWAAPVPLVWAPDVAQMGDNSFIMYYTAAWAGNSSIHCIGVATSPNITGPYTAQDEPWACPHEQGGAIDPSIFHDPDTSQPYILYKIDGNSLVGGGPCGNEPAPPSTATPASTPIMLQLVDANDWRTPVNDPIKILDREEHDGPLVEAPSMTAVRCDEGNGGWCYVLFFSSNCWSTAYYDVSYAVSTDGIDGGLGNLEVGKGFVKAGQPLLVSGMGGLNAPGGLDIAPDATHVVFHADAGPGDASLRQMRTGIVNVDGQVVTI